MTREEAIKILLTGEVTTEREAKRMELIAKFANEIKAYCRSRNNCYGCAFFDEEVAYEDGCRLSDKPMRWKDMEGFGEEE